MPKLGMGPIRRKQLVEAAIAVIHEVGFANATVVRIARKAGVSSGMVHHYFADKDELLFATMRALLAELRRDAVARQRAARTPRQRVEAVIDASFGDGQFDEKVFSAWLALYGNARQSVRLQRILGLYHRRLRANLLHDLCKLMPRPKALHLAEGIGAMIDGLWLRYALTGKPADPAHPRTLTRDYFEAARSSAAI
ncbi:MAG: transcriptional regulator BetI [Rhizobiales bacterium]|nr:transcriptional regulator BetI [Hyphomicrobiales bacterium]